MSEAKLQVAAIIDTNEKFNVLLSKLMLDTLMENDLVYESNHGIIATALDEGFLLKIQCNTSGDIAKMYSWEEVLAFL